MQVLSLRNATAQMFGFIKSPIRIARTFDGCKKDFTGQGYFGCVEGRVQDKATTQGRKGASRCVSEEHRNIRLAVEKSQGGIAMTKAEIVSKLAEDTKVTKKVAAAMLDSLVKTLQTSLKDGGKIRVNGLGTFVVVERKARTGVNPQTQAKIKIPATKAPAFRAAKALKEAVKEVPKKAGKKSK